MKTVGVTVLLVFLTGVGASGDNQSDREKLIGSWALQGAAEHSPTSSWTFSDNGKVFHVTQIERTKKVADFECSTTGTPCEIKTLGKKAIVSMWFSGPKLVQMEVKGSDVLERRFALHPQGDVMEMEIVPNVPSGKIETFQFKRVQLSAQDDSRR